MHASYESDAVEPEPDDPDDPDEPEPLWEKVWWERGRKREIKNYVKSPPTHTAAEYGAITDKKDNN
jgi:hypothetical protein